MPSRLGFALYLITDRPLSARPLSELLEECLAAGLRAVQLRDKALPVRDLLGQAIVLREATRRRAARLLINDRADVALAADADGVQRTHVSLPVAALRRILPAGRLIGASVHSIDEARSAATEGADFLVFGPVYDTPSKRAFGSPQGIPALQRVVEAVTVPVLAVGGVTPARVAEVMGAGAAGVAVIAAIVAAERPVDATKAFLDALGRA